MSAVLLVAMLAGCSGGEADGPQAAATPPLVATPGALDVVARALAGAHQGTGLAYTVVVTYPESVDYRARGAIRYAPDFAMTVTADQMSIGSAGLGPPFEQRIVGGVLYTRGYEFQKDRRWRAEPGTRPVAAFVWDGGYFGMPGSEADPLLQLGELVTGAAVQRQAAAQAGGLTRYTGELSRGSLAAQAPVAADVRRRLKVMFDREGIETVRFELWLDGTGRARRVDISVQTLGDEGVHAYSYRAGKPVVITAPTAAQLSPEPGRAALPRPT